MGLCLGGQRLWRLAGGLPRLGPSALCWPWVVRAHSPPAPPPLPLSAPSARSPPGPPTQGRRAAQASPRSGHRRGRAALPVREEEGLRASAHQPGRPQPGAALRPGVWVPPPQLCAASGAQARCAHQSRAWLWAPGALPTVEGSVRLTGALALFQTPKTCENFIKLCKKQYYDGTVFHRSIRNFVVSAADIGCPAPVGGVLPMVGADPSVGDPLVPRGLLGPQPSWPHRACGGDRGDPVVSSSSWGCRQAGGGSECGSSLACSFYRSREVTRRAPAQVGAGAGPPGAMAAPWAVWGGAWGPPEPQPTASSSRFLVLHCGEACSGLQAPAPRGSRPRGPVAGVELCAAPPKPPQPAGCLGRPTLPCGVF